MEQKVKFDGDVCYVLIPIHGEYYQKQVVMTKDVFIECYKRWIKGVEDGKDNN